MTLSLWIWPVAQIVGVAFAVFGFVVRRFTPMRSVAEVALIFGMLLAIASPAADSAILLFRVWAYR